MRLKQSSVGNQQGIQHQQPLSFVHVCECQSFNRLSCRGNMIIQQKPSSILLLRKALVSSSAMGRDVHSLMLSVQHFFCRPQSCPPSNVPWRMVFQKVVVSLDVPKRCKFLFSYREWRLSHPYCCGLFLAGESFYLKCSSCRLPQRLISISLAPSVRYRRCGKAGPLCWESTAIKGSLFWA